MDLTLNIVTIIFILSTLNNGVTGSSCSNNLNDPHRCDKVINNGMKCVLFKRPSSNCSNNELVCFKYHKMCFQMERICTPACCKNWKEDRFGRCTINTGSAFSTDTKSSNISSIVSGLVVGILFIILLAMTIIMFRICRARRNLQQLQRSTQRRQSHNSSVFTVYNNEPPPYDVAVNAKLPEYSPPINPPEYEESGQFEHSQNASANVSTSLSDQVMASAITANSSTTNIPNADQGPSLTLRESP